MWLAIDTTTKVTVIALYDDGEITERRFEPRMTQRVIFAELANLLDPDTLREIDGIAVGIGPGSFTGVKIGVIAAKTLAWSRGVPIIGIGSLDAVAAGIEPPEDSETKLVVVVPSTRGEGYICIYENVDENWGRISPIHDVPLEKESLDEILPSGKLLVSGEAGELLIDVFGDERDLESAGEKYRRPTAKGLFKLAKLRFELNDTDDPLKLAPEYIRPSQPERLEKRGTP